MNHFRKISRQSAFVTCRSLKECSNLKVFSSTFWDLSFQVEISSFLKLSEASLGSTEKVNITELEQEIRRKFETKQYRQCVGDIEKFLEIESSTFLKVLKAKYFFYFEEFDAAKTIIDEILQEDPSNLDAAYVLANCLYHQADLSASVSAYEDILKVKPDDQEVASQVEKAKQIMECINSGRKLYEQRKYRKAVRIFAKGAEIDPVNKKLTAAIHNNRGMTLKQLNYFKVAVEAFEEAFALNSEDKTVHVKGAICYYKLKKYQKYIEDCDEATKLEASQDDSQSEQMEHIKNKAKKKIMWIKPVGSFSSFTSRFKKLS